MERKIKALSFNQVIEKYLKNLSSDISFNTSPIQIYSIEKLFPYVTDLPTETHRVNFNYVVFLTEGHAHQFVDEKVHMLQKDSVLVVFQGNLLSIKQVSGDCKGFYLMFENEVVTKALTGKRLKPAIGRKPVTYLSEPDSAWTKDLLALMLKEFNGDNPRKVEIMGHLFNAFLDKIVFVDSDNSFCGRPTEITMRFKELAFGMCTNEKSIDFYSDRLHISNNYLNRCVKGATGKSAKDWIIIFSLVKAKMHLQDPAINVSEVAYLVGFQDPSYFARLFRRKYGMSPSEYRKSLFQ